VFIGNAWADNIKSFTRASFHEVIYLSQGIYRDNRFEKTCSRGFVFDWFIKVSFKEKFYLKEALGEY
jgi:hypothetical protein